MAQLYAATSCISLIFGKGSKENMKNIASFGELTSINIKERSKKLTDTFVDLLVINTLIPYFFPSKAHGKEVSEKILGWLGK